MNKIGLSDTPTKIVCLSCDVIMVAVAVGVFSLYQGRPVLFIALCAVVGVSLIYYTLGVFASGITVSEDKKQLKLRHGFSVETLDISELASVCTKPFSDGSNKTRVISLLRENGSQICYIKTYINMKDGANCETVAKQLAEAVGVPFVPSLTPGAKKNGKNEYNS